MEFYTKEKYPLRVYLEGTPTEIAKLIISLRNKFYMPTDYEKETDVDNIIFQIGQEYYFPIGLLSIIESEILKLGFTLSSTIDNSTTLEDPPEIYDDILSGITLRDYQVEGIITALRYKSGLLKLPTGSGKSELIIGICKYLLENREGNVLISVPTANLLHQTYDRLVKRGIDESCISKYGDGFKIDTECRVVVATVQTVHRRLFDEVFEDWSSNLLCLMIDEGHHSSCNTWRSIIDKLSPEYNLGFSAEPFYGDKSHIIRDLILRGTVGPIIYSVSIDYLIEKGYLSKPYYIAMETKYKGNIFEVINWQTVNKNGIIRNELRNKVITDVANLLVQRNKNPLILVSQIKHGVSLAQEISKEGCKVAMITGGSSVSIYLYGNVIDEFTDKDGTVKDDFQSGKIDVLIGTSIMDEGVDMPAIASVILAGGGKSNLKLIQRIGRGLRRRDGDSTTLIIDFQDSFNVVTRSHFKNRKQTIDKMFIPVYYTKDLNTLSSLIDDIQINRP